MRVGRREAVDARSDYEHDLHKAHLRPPAPTVSKRSTLRTARRPAPRRAPAVAVNSRSQAFALTGTVSRAPATLVSFPADIDFQHFSQATRASQSQSLKPFVGGSRLAAQCGMLQGFERSKPTAGLFQFAALLAQAGLQASSAFKLGFKR